MCAQIAEWGAGVCGQMWEQLYGTEADIDPTLIQEPQEADVDADADADNEGLRRFGLGRRRFAQPFGFYGGYNVPFGTNFGNFGGGYAMVINPYTGQPMMMWVA